MSGRVATPHLARDRSPRPGRTLVRRVVARRVDHVARGEVGPRALLRVGHPAAATDERDGAIAERGREASDTPPG